MDHRVLTSPHIIYQIFLHLPQQDLLLAQRVCRTWRDVIKSSKALLAALFLHPGPAVRQPFNGEIQLNPLLQSRFPSFFNNNRMFTDFRPSGHGMGPWFSTHWAESIRPWHSVSRRVRNNPRLPVESPRLDPRRTAAYKRPEASWRGMIPCIPAPAELQVSHLYKTSLSPPPWEGTLRCLMFNNQDSCLDAGAAVLHQGTQDKHSQEALKKPWLTFGLLYDIVAAAWFSGMPMPTDTVQCDYTFHDHRPPVARQSLPWHTHQHQQTREESQNLRLYGNRETLRDAIPQKLIGGRGRILIMLTGHHGSPPLEKRYRDEFELGAADVLENLRWDEVIEYRSM